MPKDEKSTPAEPEPQSEPVKSEAQNPTTGATVESGAKTFTQEEFNQILAQRLQQERSKYADYDAVKAQNEQLAREREAEKRVTELAEQNKTLTATQQKTATEAALIRAAAKLGLDAEAAVKLAEPSQFKLSEAGALENADEIAKGIAERFPGLTKRPVPPQAAVNPQDGGDNQTRVAPEVLDAQRRARYFGGGGGASGFWTGGGVRLPTKDE